MTIFNSNRFGNNVAFVVLENAPTGTGSRSRLRSGLGIPAPFIRSHRYNIHKHLAGTLLENRSSVSIRAIFKS